jgi:pimeloyl-ACP methyl ester carboxylesterase
MADRRLVASALVCICALVYLFSVYSLSTSAGGVSERYYPDDTPVLVLSPPDTPHGTLVIAHGFAANIGMMKPIGYYVARHVYKVVLFDFPGYGNSRLKVNETDMSDALAQVCTLYGGDNYSLAGHSLGSYAVLNYSQSGNGKAVIGLSSFYSDVNRTSPRNMLLIAGTGDMSTVVSSLPQAVANGTGVAAPEEHKLYGNFSDGTARAYEYVNANHITILFNHDAWQDTVRWLDSTYGYDRVPDSYRQGISLVWAFAAIAAALVAFLPGLYLLTGYLWPKGHLPESPVIEPLWRPLLVAFAGSLLAALAVQVFNPAYYTGIMMADRLIGFLFYAGVFTVIIRYFTGSRKGPGLAPDRLARSFLLAMVAGILLVTAIAYPMSMSFYEQPTVPGRLLLIAVVAVLTLPFFIAGDVLARRTAGPKSFAAGSGIRVIALALVAASYALAGNVFFDFVILPVILPLFLGLEIVSFYAYRWTGSVFAGALLNALITGWLLASAFPIAMI